jgi:DNA-binding CsgD family transcriptional regulator
VLVERAGQLLERAHELAVVEQAIAASFAGQGRALVIEGAAGIGKTSLLQVAIGIAADRGAAVARSCGTMLERDFGFGVVRQLFEARLAGADPADRARLLEGTAGLAAPVVTPTTVTAALPPARQAAVIHGLYWLTANLADCSPLLIAVDDAQWSDSPSIQFLAYLARRLEDLPVLLVLAIRTGDPQVDPGALAELVACPDLRVVRPAPLSVAGVALLVRDRLGERADDAFVVACHHASGGVPFLAHQLTAALDAEHVPPTAAAVHKLTEVGLGTVAHATTLRISRLPPAALAVARAIAVLDPRARIDRVASLAAVDEHTVHESVQSLTDMEILAPGPSPAFAHPLVHRAIYDDIPATQRADAHRRAAQVLTDQHAPLDEIAAHLLCTEPAGRDEVADTLQAAAGQARERGATESVVAYLRRALAEGTAEIDDAALLHQLGSAEAMVGDPAAVGHLEDAQRLAEDPVTRSRIGMTLSELALLGGHRAESVVLLHEAVAELGDRDPDLAARLEAVRAGRENFDPRTAAEFEGRYPYLRSLVDRGGKAARALALYLACLCATHCRNVEEIRALAEIGFDRGGLVRDEGAESLAIPQGIGALSFVDDVERLESSIQGTFEDARHRGSLLGFGAASLYRATLDAQRGHLTTAEAHLRTVVEIALDHGMTFALPTAFWFGADVLLERPGAADIAAHVDAIDMEPAEAASINGAMVGGVDGRLRLARGDLQGAITALRAAGALFTEARWRNPLAAFWRSPLALALPRDEREEARALVADELEAAAAAGLPRSRGVALRAAAALEDGERGIELLSESLRLLTPDHMVLERARTLVELGAALRRCGRRVAAREPLRAGLDLAERCGAVRLTERALDELRISGARPRRRALSGPDSLTPSEARVAQMAAAGMSNRDIAQTLFVSVKTIENQLGSAYRKLGVNSREQLDRALAQRDQEGPPPGAVSDRSAGTPRTS